MSICILEALKWLSDILKDDTNVVNTLAYEHLRGGRIATSEKEKICRAGENTPPSQSGEARARGPAAIRPPDVEERMLKSQGRRVTTLGSRPL